MVTLNKRRFWLLNVFLGFVALVIAMHGLVVPLYAHDGSYLTFAITALLAAGLHQAHATAWDRVSDIADDMVFLGLLGTVIGFALALAGLTPERMLAGQGAEMVGVFVQGAKTALYTTIVGVVGNCWLRVNYLLLRG